MTRLPLIATTCVLIALAGCNRPDVVTDEAAVSNQSGATADAGIENLPSDGLAAPDDMPMDMESNDAGGIGGNDAS